MTSSRGGSDKIRVLVIEDDPALLQLIPDLLDKIGNGSFDVICAECLATALNRLAEEKFDVILLDLVLPDSTAGMDTLSRTRARAPQVPIVVLTGFDNEEWMAGAVQRGAQDFLVKGQVSGTLLVRSLRYAIERNRLLVDLTEKTRELQASEARFRTIIEKDADGILIVDKNAILRFINPAAEAILERSAEELVGQWFGFPMLAGEKADLDLVREDGRPRVAEMRVVKISWEGQPAYLATLRDVTDRKQAAEELTGANDELVLRNEQIRRFNQSLSHELNTPLAAIKEFLSLLLEEVPGPLTDDQRTQLRLAKDSCDQMARCVSDLLDVARLETGKLAIRSGPGSIGDLLTQVVTAISPAASNHGVRLRCAVERELPDVLMDAQRISQVLTNLLTNALKFTPAGGEVVVTAADSKNAEGFVAVSVSDTGQGIPKDDIGHIFDPLYQARGIDSSSNTGLGLGLSICRGLVDLHGGKIGVDSEPGKGSTFTLPKHCAHSARPESLVREQPT